MLKNDTRSDTKKLIKILPSNVGFFWSFRGKMSTLKVASEVGLGRLPPCPPLLLRVKTRFERLQNTFALLKRYTSRKYARLALRMAQERRLLGWGAWEHGRLPMRTETRLFIMI